ncbi:MAG: DUF255 domain-containing protein [Gammaproteobacteria bacterium]|nr:DUF255 domain-containing protein [Gammaproteobacteria bacterium]
MLKLFTLLLCLFTLPLFAGNELKNHFSPYLAMHGDDPVQWRAWGADVLEQAKKENKLILISSGYFACHWCHVMQRESYQNPAIAKLLNDSFIAVKVDRELDVALDALLIRFVQQMNGSAGWPLNVFLTPEGYPLLGLTYRPAESFEQLLINLRERWQESPQRLAQMAQMASGQIFKKVALEQGGVRPVAELRQELVEQALKLGDELQGGFGEQSKFPRVPMLSSLLLELQSAPNEELEAFLRLTLDQMAHLALRDHLGGGFYRYTVDPGWQQPHFEKMLYDNALAVSLYLQAAQILDQPRYRQIAFETLDFMLAEMAHQEGGFIASLSAVDDDGNEGGSYLWQREELMAVLSKAEFALADRLWSWLPISEGEQVLGLLPVAIEKPQHLAKELKMSFSLLQEEQKIIRAKLHRWRLQNRSLPKDGKRLAGWNGLALSALCQASVAPEGERFQTAASKQLAFVNGFWSKGELRRELSSTKGAAFAGYTTVAQGLWRCAVAFPAQKKALQDRVAELSDRAWSLFYRQGSWRLGQKPLLPVLLQRPLLDDGPLPSPSALLLKLSPQVLAAGYQPNWKADYQQALQAAGRFLSGQTVLWYAEHIELFVSKKSPLLPDLRIEPETR